MYNRRAIGQVRWTCQFTSRKNLPECVCPWNHTSSLRYVAADGSLPALVTILLHRYAYVCLLRGRRRLTNGVDAVILTLG